jgi:uncharacterized protein (TIGR02453 family)
MTNGFRGFPPETLKFLKQLKRNNNREWFLAHKDIYEQKVKAPMTELVFDLGFALQQVAPELIVDPKRVIYRINRDIRFSADKSPYKTHIAAMFVPRGIPKNTGAALYFHIEPGQVMVAGGTYMPDSATLRTLRRHIATHWEGYEAITNRRSFRKMFGDVQGDRLVRPPAGFSADHPAIDALRRKQHYVMQTEPAELAAGPKLLPRLLALFSAMIPFVRFLNIPLQSLSGGASKTAFDRSLTW